MDYKPKSKGPASSHPTHISRSASFSGRFSGEPLEKILDPKSKKGAAAPGPMRRPQTHPELLRRDKPAFERTPWLNLEAPPAEVANNMKTPTKVLVNVTVARSIGPLRLLMAMDASVVDVVKAALGEYAKEGRKPLLSTHLYSFALHYSQFTIDCLNPSEKIKDLGSRNFFLCAKKERSVSRSCGREMGKLGGQEREAWFHFNSLTRFLALP